MDKLWDAILSNGYPTTMVSGLILIVFYFRRQEAGVRVELNTTLQRLQREKEALQATIDRLEAEARAREEEFDRLRKERREAEDRAADLSRQLLEAEGQLRMLQKQDRNEE